MVVREVFDKYFRTSKLAVSGCFSYPDDNKTPNPLLLFIERSLFLRILGVKKDLPGLMAVQKPLDHYYQTTKKDHPNGQLQVVISLPFNNCSPNPRFLLIESSLFLKILGGRVDLYLPDLLAVWELFDLHSQATKTDHPNLADLGPF